MKIQKLIAIIIFSLSSVLISCKGKKVAAPVDQPAPTSKTVQSGETVQTMEAVAEALLKAVQGNSSSFKKYLPDAAFARVLSPKETEGMTDKVIESQMLSGLTTRLEDNVNNLKNDMSAKRINSSSVSIESVKEEPSTDPPLVPRVVSVRLANDAWKASVPVTYVRHDDKIYVFEILNSVDLFKKKE